MEINTEKYFVFASGWWWGRSIVLVCKDGSCTIELQFEYDMPNSVYLKGLQVNEPFRRQGIATGLLAYCEELARQDGRKFITLSVEYDNEWLLEFYKRIGYSVLNRSEHIFEMIKVIS